mmetsp:Transcript_56339/g.123423  ORF Transcript_56339/g.123423 Transcript_56339/m.123423 type:complete len:389 (-) Transcript_56339:289-1455(-)
MRVVQVAFVATMAQVTNGTNTTTGAPENSTTTTATTTTTTTTTIDMAFCKAAAGRMAALEVTAGISKSEIWDNATKYTDSYHKDATKEKAQNAVEKEQADSELKQKIAAEVAAREAAQNNTLEDALEKLSDTYAKQAKLEAAAERALDEAKQGEEQGVAAARKQGRHLVDAAREVLAGLGNSSNTTNTTEQNEDAAEARVHDLGERMVGLAQQKAAELLEAATTEGAQAVESAEKDANTTAADADSREAAARKEVRDTVKELAAKQQDDKEQNKAMYAANQEHLERQDEKVDNRTQAAVDVVETHRDEQLSSVDQWLDSQLESAKSAFQAHNCPEDLAPDFSEDQAGAGQWAAAAGVCVVAFLGLAVRRRRAVPEGYSEGLLAHAVVV